MDQTEAVTGDDLANWQDMADRYNAAVGHYALNPPDPEDDLHMRHLVRSVGDELQAWGVS